MKGYFHLSVEVISRGKGRSAVACAAYRSGTKLEDQRYGKTHDYSPRSGIQSHGITLPDGAPAWASDREQLWNRLEEFERRKDAQLAREFVVGLPHQLTPEEQHLLLSEFVRREITSRGLVADWAIHDANHAGDHRNIHAHVMVTMRGVTPGGFDPTKDRSMNTPAQLNAWRKSWADIQNEAFSELGILDTGGAILQVDHRSYDAQGVSRIATVHMGVHATAMERRGRNTELGEMNRSIQLANENEHLGLASGTPTEALARAIAKKQSHRSVKALLENALDRPDDFEPSG